MVFVGFSDDGRLVVQFDVAVFVLVIIVLVGVSAWRDVAHDTDEALQSRMEKVLGMRWVMSAPCCAEGRPNLGGESVPVSRAG
jgi:hypothetical protein